MKDYYHILGIEKSATTSDVKQAYRRLAFQYHPDVNNSKSSHQRFIEINQAYQVLRDRTKRFQYDRVYKSGVYSKRQEGKVYKRERKGQEKARYYKSASKEKFEKKVKKSTSSWFSLEIIFELLGWLLELVFYN